MEILDKQVIKEINFFVVDISNLKNYRQIKGIYIYIFYNLLLQ